MTTAEAAKRWAREWERAWREHDVEAVGALYAPAARFYSDPFRDRQQPRAYVAWAFESELPGPEVRFAEPLLTSDGSAVVEWWAATRDRGSDAEESLAGVSLLRFDERGFVVEQRDYFGRASGRHEPFAD